jgi:hypothetical protein
MSPLAADHLHEARISIGEAIRDGRQATTIGLAVLLGVSLLKDSVNLPEDSLRSVVVSGFESAGNVFAGAVLTLGLGSAAVSGFDAIHHKVQARRADKTEARLAQLRQYTPTAEESRMPRYYPERYDLTIPQVG